jgi:putative methyltransferase (TIGR04325 family)
MTTNRRFKVWEGVYDSFSAANADAGVFEQDVWVNKVKAQAQAAIAESQSSAAIAPIAETRDYALPIVAALAARPGAPLRILDFGGGLGFSFIPLLKMLPDDQTLEYVIVENSAICDAGRELFADDVRIRFRSELPNSTERFDIVHCGSSIHYVDDWTNLLTRFASMQPRFMVFVDLPAADNKSFVTTQQYYGRRIPVNFWNLTEFKAAMSALDFNFVFQARYRGPYAEKIEIPVTFQEPGCDVEYFSQVIFRSGLIVNEGRFE